MKMLAFGGRNIKLIRYIKYLLIIMIRLNNKADI